MEQLQAAWGTLMNKAGEILAVAPAGTRWYSDADHSPPTPLNQLTSFKKRAAVLLLTPSQLDLPPTVTRTLQSWLSQPSFVLKATLEPLLSDSVAPADALWSVVAALRYLLGDSGKVVPREVFTTILQFPDSLPDDKWTTITDIVAEIIRGKIKSHTNLQPTLPEWLVDAVILLLSRPTHEVSRDAAACLELLFGHTPRIVNLVWKRTSASAFVPLSRRLASICTNGLTLKACLDLYACYLAPEDKLNSQSDPSSRSVSSSQPDPNTQPDLAKTAARRSLTEILRMQNPRKPEVLKDLWEFLEKCVPQLNIPSPQWRDVSAEVIGVLMLLSRCVFEMDASGGLLKLFRSMWANEGSFGIFWLLATLHPKDRLQDPGILDTCRNLLRAAGAYC
ncbi:uncharacterized protein PHACADRAFT_263472 [Phanerochaete carnosa HHB-10118-sp]|uniref:Uncharacterized protein n=1 Tax=Phanerochaete carnosa (strain HHB-10118-sp) TaxID=650164 RepID=K5VJ92_PHACS|nr:uncharacterized protein PHACADRAFT_263472 [Phanerochaete carnosa HHB-10118-sp]EKM51378.1 hypothetical protein PHACADRAFT_263472 [Phanerochaete carnosa HHB-10118-sp]